jgi:hypothetical protein
MSLSARSKANTGVANRWLGVVAVALAVLTLLVLILFLGDRGYDDPFITFRYASNLLAGNGFVYNVGQRTLSTTAPLYALLLAGLGLAWPDLPALSNALSALALVGSAAVLYKWSQARGQQAAGLIAGLLLVLTSLLLMTFGAETCLYVMLILAGFYAYDRQRLDLSALALALAVMVRPDGVLAAIALGLYHVMRRRPVPWRPVLLYAGLVGLWHVGLWIYFGSPLPVTLLAKQQQGEMAISTRFGAGLLDLLGGYARQPLYWLQGILALLGLGRVLKVDRYWAPLLVWTLLYLLAYTFLGVSRYFWYYAPLVPAVVVLVAEGAVVLVRGLARTRLPRLAKLCLSGLLLLALLAPMLPGVVWTGWQRDPRVPVYREVGQWLEAHTPLQASVGALEVGVIGYYARRPMIDFAGLIQPDVARRFTATTTYQESATWSIQTYQPDYVVLHRREFASVAGQGWFKASYRPLRDFADQDALWLTLYQRSAAP